MKLHVIRTGVLKVNTLIVPIGDNQCFVVDPAACELSGDSSVITDFLAAHNLVCKAIVLTHAHFDHITGIVGLKSVFPDAKIALHQAELLELSSPPGPMNSSVMQFFGAPQLFEAVAAQPAADTPLQDNSIFFGWKVIHTPGHTPGSICLYNATAGESGQGVLISGDTLFDYGGYGRTDMYGGNEIEIHKSLERLRREIPEGTLVYPGHDNFGFSFKSDSIN